MRSRRRTNFLVGLVVLAIAVIVLVQSLGLIPAPIYDLLLRAWPSLLVLLGLAFLLRGRLPFAGAIALVVSIVVTVGVAAYAFSSRATQQRDDYVETIAQPIQADMPLLRIRVSTLSTDVELLRGLSADAGVTGRFVGSAESVVAVSYEESDDGSATMVVTETRPNALPMLNTVGRGTLRLEIPPQVPVDVAFTGAEGGLTLNMSETRLERLNVDLARGDALVTLPQYQPLYSNQDDSLGTLAVRDGNITIAVPSTVAARLQLDRGGSGINPEYDTGVYNFLLNTMLEARAIEIAETIVQYNVVSPRGRIRLVVVPVAESTPEPQATAAATASP